MLKIKNLKFKLLVSIAVLLYAAVLYILPISCPILSITGIRCFGCGMTRALLAALRFDFATAFSYHMMFWSVPFLYVCFLYDGKLFKKKTLNTLLYVIILIGFIINWITHGYI